MLKNKYHLREQIVLYKAGYPNIGTSSFSRIPYKIIYLFILKFSQTDR